MARADHIALPHWALNQAAHALIEQIITERPDYRSTQRYAWTNTREPKFKGETAKALREMWEHARDLAMDAGDRDAWGELGHDHPDDLIARVLRETEAVQIVDVERLEPRDGYDERIAA
jgi:hypothetical protein